MFCFTSLQKNVERFSRRQSVKRAGPGLAGTAPGGQDPEKIHCNPPPQAQSNLFDAAPPPPPNPLRLKGALLTAQSIRRCFPRPGDPRPPTGPAGSARRALGRRLPRGLGREAGVSPRLQRARAGPAAKPLGPGSRPQPPAPAAGSADRRCGWKARGEVGAKLSPWLGGWSGFLLRPRSRRGFRVSRPSIRLLRPPPGRGKSGRQTPS